MTSCLLFRLSCPVEQGFGLTGKETVFFHFPVTLHRRSMQNIFDKVSSLELGRYLGKTLHELQAMATLVDMKRQELDYAVMRTRSCTKLRSRHNFVRLAAGSTCFNQIVCSPFNLTEHLRP